jgi:hypothetical protein
MRRWILALFALQFFCSVSAFTFASTDLLQSTRDSAGVAYEVSNASLDATEKGVMSALDPVHGLLDDIPELPECLDVVIGETAIAAAWDVPLEHPIAELTPPALDGPQRPPRRLLALA